MRALLVSALLASAALAASPAQASWLSQYLHDRYGPTYSPYDPRYEPGDGYPRPGYRYYPPDSGYYPPLSQPAAGLGAQGDDTAFVVSLYHDYLGREPRSWEVDGWLQRLDRLRRDRARLAEEFQRGAQVELSQRSLQRR